MEAIREFVHAANGYILAAIIGYLFYMYHRHMTKLLNKAMDVINSLIVMLPEIKETAEKINTLKTKI